MSFKTEAVRLSQIPPHRIIHPREIVHKVTNSRLLLHKRLPVQLIHRPADPVVEERGNSRIVFRKVRVNLTVRYAVVIIDVQGFVEFGQLVNLQLPVTISIQHLEKIIFIRPLPKRVQPEPRRRQCLLIDHVENSLQKLRFIDIVGFFVCDVAVFIWVEYVKKLGYCCCVCLADAAHRGVDPLVDGGFGQIAGPVGAH